MLNYVPLQGHYSKRGASQSIFINLKLPPANLNTGLLLIIYKSMRPEYKFFPTQFFILSQNFFTSWRGIPCLSSPGCWLLQRRRAVFQSASGQDPPRTPRGPCRTRRETLACLKTCSNDPWTNQICIFHRTHVWPSVNMILDDNGGNMGGKMYIHFGI